MGACVGAFSRRLAIAGAALMAVGTLSPAARAAFVAIDNFNSYAQGSNINGQGGWGTGTDPYTLENIFKTGEERNYGSYSSPEVDALFEAGMLEHDLDERAEIYRKIALILYEDQPYTWLFHQNAFYGFNKSLRGYMFSPRGPYTYGPGFSSIWKPAQ